MQMFSSLSSLLALAASFSVESADFSRLQKAQNSIFDFSIVNKKRLFSRSRFKLGKAAKNVKKSTGMSKLIIGMTGK